MASSDALDERLRALKQGTRDHQWMSQAEKLALIDVALAAEARRQAADEYDHRGGHYDAVSAAEKAEDDALTALAGVLGGDAS